MDLGLEPDSCHAERSFDPVLVVDNEFLGKNMDDFPVKRDGNSFGRFNDAVNICLCDFFSFDCDDAMTVHAVNVASGNTHKNRIDFASRHQFGFFNSTFYRFHGAVYVYDHTFTQAS